MRKTNVMVEVSDEVYETVVSPYKSKKQFGKLMCMLLEAYAYNDSVYNYINGVMDGLEDKATEELIKDLNYMSDSLSMFGALNQQAEAVIYNGQKSFDDFSRKASDDMETGMGYGGESSANPKEDTNNKEPVMTKEDVVKIVNDSVSDIRDMLKELLHGATVSTVEEPDRGIHESTGIIEDSSSYESSSSRVELIDDEDEAADEVSEEAIEAQDALSSLLGSIGF